MRKLETLDLFIQRAQHLRYGDNAYVECAGFDSLYVRLRPRYVNGVQFRPVLDIANVTAAVPGSGVFTALIKRLRVDYPQLHLYVECVQQERFGLYLARNGFRVVGDGTCYFLEVKQ